MKEIVITYCKPCGYLKRAEQAASIINDRFKIKAELIPGKGGIFEITVGGKVVSKKLRTGFPSEEEILAAVLFELS